MQEGHMPVMPAEVLETLAPASGSLQIDATVGGGGHTERILEAASPDGRVLGLDADAAAIARVARAPGPVRRPPGPAPGRTSGSWPTVAPEARASGPSTARCSTSACRRFQLADRDRGFGFRTGGPLDMRFDTTTGVPAAELLATLDADELAALFRALRRGAGGLADRQGDRRGPARPRPSRPPRSWRPWSSGSSPGTRGSGAASTPRPACSRRSGSPSTRSSTRSRTASRPRVDLLRPGGRLVVLSYHSLEDRIVKRFLAAERRGCTCPPEAPVCVCGKEPRLRLVTRPSLTPTEDGDHRQPARQERAAPRRRAARRVAGEEEQQSPDARDPAPTRHRRIRARIDSGR